jgi:type II secretory pathway component PulF
LDLALQLRTSLGAGLSPAQGLRGLAEPKGRGFRFAPGWSRVLTLSTEQWWRFAPAAEAAEDGAGLAEALRSTKLIDDWEARLLEAGERAGRLDAAIDAWIDALRVRASGARIFPNILLYPLLVAFLAFWNIGLLLWKVVPTLAHFYTGAGVPMPRSTVWAIQASHLGFQVVMVAGVLLGLLILLKLVARFVGGPVGRACDRVLFFLPWMGPARRAVARSLGLEAAAAALDAGDSDSEALLAAAEVQAHPSANGAWLRVSRALGDGDDANAAGLLGRRFLRSLTTVLAGEDRAERLRTLARRELSSWWRAAETTLAWLEPVMILGLGLFLGAQLVGWWMLVYSSSWLVMP